MEDKITIIEGPPPTFEVVSDGWPYGLYEGPYLYKVAVTRLRTFNAPALIERCHRAWRKQDTIQLEYREQDGLENQAPILAARALELEEGQMIVLWVLLPIQDQDDAEDNTSAEDSDSDYDLGA